MNSHNEASMRLKLAEGFLKEAQQDFDLKRWRSCVDNAQLSCENSAKAIIALYEPPEKSHEPSEQLLRIATSYSVQPKRKGDIEKLAQLSQQLGWEVHVLSDYGDIAQGRLPWEIYGETEANKALDIATAALALTRILLNS